MTRATFCMTFALAALLALAAESTRGAEPRPAGYERMILPTADYNYELYTAPDWTYSYSAVLFSHGGTPGYRIVDLEVDRFNFSPSADEKPEFPDHIISFTEVRNEGEFETKNWGVVLGETDFYWFLDNMNWRPIDLELYYRKDPHTGDVVPTYAYVAVENEGLDFAVWDWIPPTPHLQFMDLLNHAHADGWRPYDVEFAIDDLGQAVATALLARNDTWETDTLVPTKWEWFQPNFVGFSLDEDGDGVDEWTLLDVERPLDVAYSRGHRNPFNPDILPTLFEDGYRFGIFVHTSFVQPDATSTDLHSSQNQAKVDSLSKDLEGKARLIDIEYDTEYSVPAGQAFFPQYDTVWLHAE